MNRRTYIAVPDVPGRRPEVTATNKGRVVVMGGFLVEDVAMPSAAQNAVASAIRTVHYTGAHEGPVAECEDGCLDDLTAVGLTAEDLERMA